MLIKIFRYIESLWTGKDGKPSIRTVMAIVGFYNFIQNMTYAIHRWDSSKSLDGLAFPLSVEAGLVLSLLGLKAWENINSKDLKKDVPSISINDGKEQVEEVK